MMMLMINTILCPIIIVIEQDQDPNQDPLITSCNAQPFIRWFLYA